VVGIWQARHGRQVVGGCTIFVHAIACPYALFSCVHRTVTIQFTATRDGPTNATTNLRAPHTYVRATRMHVYQYIVEKENTDAAHGWFLQNFLDSPSHQIFRRMHEVLNIDENKN